jgi:hypothetical protein
MAPVKARKKKEKAKQITLLGQALRNLGGIGGGALGSFIGQAEAGGGVGRSFGAAISRWLGSGDYKVASNTLITPSGSIPVMHREGQSVIVRHKEFIGNVVSSTGYSVQYSLPLNPGLTSTFPWLSRVADSFQEYRIRGMVFHYVPSSGDAVASTNPALGTVMFQTSYRSTDSAPTSKLEILNEYWSSENVPSQPFCHPIECDPKENPFNVQYVRTGTVPSGDSQLMYDLGTTHVATQGMQTSGNPVGDLWVTYEIELKKPIVHSNVTSHTGYFQCTSTGTITTSNYWAGTQTNVAESNLNVVLSPTGRTVTFPTGLHGNYSLLLVIRPATTFTAATFNTNCTYTNCVQRTAPWNSTAYSYGTAITSGGDMFFVTDINITDSTLQASVTYGANSWTGTALCSILSITQLP